MDKKNALPKSQRLCSRLLIDRLFQPGGSKSFAAYPLRLVICTVEGEENQLLISVPKRNFRHAVDRNRVKRQVREAYRTNKHLLTTPAGTSAVMAFIWLDSRHHTTEKVAAKVRNLLKRASESLCAD